MNDLKNLTITILLSTLVLVGWQYFYENPKQQANHQPQIQASSPLNKELLVTHKLSREESINQSENHRITIQNDKLSGSINLVGSRIDDLKLTNYYQTIGSSEKVVLLSPANTNDAYFIDFGWASSQTDLELPTQYTLWTSEQKELNSDQSITLSWLNKQNIKFIIKISVDENYLFKVTQRIENNSNNVINISSYGLINKTNYLTKTSNSILHEGPITVANGVLVEIPYADITVNQTKSYNNNFNSDWLGITDKYWLTAIIPHPATSFNSNITRLANNEPQFQVDYINQIAKVEPKSSIEEHCHFFVGAKNLDLLDDYAKKLNIKLFDRAVDFGWFYFLTKPMFNALQYLNKLVGNFGLAILLITVLVKILMYPMANKSYHSMSKMKTLQPQMVKIREHYQNDKMQLNKEIMSLYQKEGVNPVSGCLPLIIQIPVFFSLYKVLFVALEMRHAPFFGWIYDLSAPDPTSLFNLFGLINWQPPGFLMIGVWPLIMGLTMYWQQKMNPEPADPVQAQVMKFLPLFFVFMFNSFPAGLIIYWAWNNTLSILQQWLINKSMINSK